MMTDDVIFMTPSGRPSGKEAFAAVSENMKNVKLGGRCEIQELKVFGDWPICGTTSS
jgi:ketosteroid isomerase-like protein